MDGFVKTLGVLMVLAAVALWAALIFFVPAALIKFLWPRSLEREKVLTPTGFFAILYKVYRGDVSKWS